MAAATDPDPSSPNPPDGGDDRNARSLDLRLAGPAIGAWLAALVLLGANPTTAYITAAALLIGALTLLIRPRPIPLIHSSGREIDARSATGTSLISTRLKRSRPDLPPRSGRRQRRYRVGLAAVLVCAAASAFGVGLRLTAVGSGPVREMAARTATVRLEAVVTGDPKATVKTGSIHHRETVIVPVRVEALQQPRDAVTSGSERSGPHPDGATASGTTATSTAGSSSATSSAAGGKDRAEDTGPTRGGFAAAGRRGVAGGGFAAAGRRGVARGGFAAAERRRVRVPVLVLADDPAWKGVLPSLRVRFTARLLVPRHGELLAAVALVRGPPVTLHRPSALQRAAGRIRVRLRAAANGLPSDQRGVLPGLVDGDTSLLEPDLADAFEKAGLTHLMAVSGENLSLILGAVLALGRALRLGRRAGPLLAGASMIGFVIVARPSPSVLRATVMGAIALIAIVSGRERHGISAVCAAVLVLVLIDPELARSYGFALSALATAGILILAPPWRARLSRRMPRALAEPIAVSAAAHVACLPVLAMLGAGVSMVAIPANLLAVPAVGPATLAGVFAAVVAPVSLPMARLIVVPAGFAVGWITGVARFCAQVPYAVIAWPAGLGGVALVLAVALVGMLTLRRPLARRIAAAAFAGIVVIAIAMRLFVPGWPPRGWLFVTCDVGQGDGLALYAGKGQAVVVDTGPDPRLMDRCLRDLRVGAVPLLFLTHPHADHIDGLPGVLRGRSVGTIVISPDSDGEERRLLPGRATRTTAVGDTWTLGSLSLRVLGPMSTERVTEEDSGTTVNNASIVMLASWPGLKVLLCGDVEIEAQRELLDAGLPTAQVLKVPHHGSSSQDPEFLSAVHARIAIASVGAHNDYGHPAPSTMAELAHLGERVYRTDRDGDVAVVRSATGLAVVTHHT